MENSSDKCLESAVTSMLENVLLSRRDLASELSAGALYNYFVKSLLRCGFFCQCVVDQQSCFEEHAVFRRQLSQEVLVDEGRFIHKNRCR